MAKNGDGRSDSRPADGSSPPQGGHDGLWRVPPGAWRAICVAGVVGAGAMVAAYLKHRAEERQVLETAKLTAVGIKDTVRVIRAVGKAHATISQAAASVGEAVFSVGEAVASVGGAVEDAAVGASTVGAEVAQEVAGAVQGMAEAVQEVAEAWRQTGWQVVARSAEVGSGVQGAVRGAVSGRIETLVVDAGARVRVKEEDSLWGMARQQQVLEAHEMRRG
ncbi:hypothetical protein CLOM_g16605 [Closterium sp. NIES-68]|nr:hypothetical protein CLOM_g16605 [Closterium sp. NIES-68]